MVVGKRSMAWRRLLGAVCQGLLQGTISALAAVLNRVSQAQSGQ